MSVLTQWLQKWTCVEVRLSPGVEQVDLIKLNPYAGSYKKDSIRVRAVSGKVNSHTELCGAKFPRAHRADLESIHVPVAPSKCL